MNELPVIELPEGCPFSYSDLLLAEGLRFEVKLPLDSVNSNRLLKNVDHRHCLVHQEIKWTNAHFF